MNETRDTIKFSYEGDPQHLKALLLGLLSPARAESAPSEAPEFQPSTGPCIPWRTADVEADLAKIGMVSDAVAATEQDLPGYPAVDIASVPSPGSDIESEMSAEAQLQHRPAFDFEKIPLDPEAWSVFSQAIQAWAVDFDGPLDANGDPIAPQPDRLSILKSLGEGRWPIFILRWLAHYTCLQKAVREALSLSQDPSYADNDLADRISANIVQLSHAAFPDIAGFHDHSTRWRRS